MYPIKTISCFSAAEMEPGQSGWLISRLDGKKTTLLMFQQALNGVGVPGDEGNIASCRLYRSQRDTPRILIRLCKDFAGSRWSCILDLHFDLVFMKSGYLGALLPQLMTT